MPKPKFVELIITGSNYPKHSLTGYFVISECRNHGNVELFLRLPDQDAGPPEKKVRKKKAAMLDMPDSLKEAL